MQCVRCQLCLYVTQVTKSVVSFLVLLLLLFLLGIPLSFMELGPEYDSLKADVDASEKLVAKMNNFNNLTKLDDFSKLEAGCAFTYDIDCDPHKLDSGCNWDIEGSMFFLMTIGTTIGYGNYTPRTLGGQIYVVCVLVVLLGVAGNTYISVSTTMVKFVHLIFTGILCGADKEKIINKKLRLHHKAFNDDNPDISLAEFLSMVDDLKLKPIDEHLLNSILEHSNNKEKETKNLSEISFKFEDYCKFCHEHFDSRELLVRTLRMNRGVLFEAFMITLIYVIGVLGFATVAWAQSLTTDDKQDFWTAYWFSIITFTTIGLGDYTPSSFGMHNHVLNTFMILIGLGLFASVISVWLKVVKRNIAPLPCSKKLDGLLLCRRCQRLPADTYMETETEMLTTS